MDEISRAVNKLKDRKAPGVDNITVEEIKAAMNDDGLKVMYKLCKPNMD